MTLLVLVARLALAAVFVVSAVAKLRDHAGSRAAVADFRVPSTLVPTVTAALPVIELAGAVLVLCADPAATVGAAGLALLLLAFTGAVALNLVRGRTPDCHCFGQLSSGPTGWSTVARNAGLLVLPVLVLTQAGSVPAVTSSLREYRAGQIAVGIAFTVLAAAVIALGLFCQTLLRRYGEVLLRVEALEAGPAQPRPAPEFTLSDLNDEPVSLDDALAPGSPVMVVFISPTCTHCAELFPDLAQWQDGDAPITVLVISDGTSEAIRDKIASAPGLRVLQDPERAVAESYGLYGTPGAFLVGADGRITGEGVYGVEDIRANYAAVVASEVAEGAHDHGPALHQIGPRPVQVGDPLPDVMVRTEDDETVALAKLAEQDTVLLFWRSDCGYCAQIADDVTRLETQSRVLLITGSDVGAVRLGGPQSPVIRDDGAAGSAFQVPGTPAAVRIRQGKVAAPVAVGGPDVLALLSRAGNDQER